MNRPVYIIAEAGVNHNGDLKLAKRLVAAAAAAGVDAVKFQSFKAAELVRADAPKADYQRRTTGAGETQYDMLRRLELSEEDHSELAELCARLDIEFMSTPFDLASARFLAGLGLKRFKVSSGDLTNLPLLRYLGGLGRPVILSTGLAETNEIKAGVEALVKAGLGLENITLLHCTTSYPTPVEEANLLAISTLKKEFPGVAIGFSDHTPGLEASLAAVALGAEVIEKHFTLNKNLPGPDHRASLDLMELIALAEGVRRVAKALGDGRKIMREVERPNQSVARKSIVAARDIAAGEFFSEDNLTVKRPGDGLSPLMWDMVIGRRAGRAFKRDENIELEP